MAHILSDRTREFATVTGNSNPYTLTGAVTGFQDFDATMATNDTCWYMATSGANWEVGVGTFTSSSSDTIARTTILASSNGGLAVVWPSASTVDIHLVLLAANVGQTGDGTVGAPGQTFWADPDNGSYRIGANNWAGSVGGVKVLEFLGTAVGIGGTPS